MIDTLKLAHAAEHLAQIAHAAIDRPEHYAKRLEEAKRAMREALQSPAASTQALTPDN